MLRNIPRGVMRPEIVRIVTGNFEQKQKLTLLEQLLQEAKRKEPDNKELQKAIHRQMRSLLQDCVHPSIIVTPKKYERTLKQRLNSLPDSVISKKRKG